ncbi:glycoside hydrolase family 16 protein [Burkholderia multivorans]|uniref:glycoside hydrolase family 16 protein n=1 Tax=Burkholderia multivorans TaxID=87883 RepID=UPI00143E2C5D|nr:glycoside hydrolase family 16 protein [Burkholderia multivorans]MBU9416125.1 glycoside hydrolase family 16 protein [Burkholderia multivorans]QIX16741.1 glycoside hydrolase family 16 protein [Burkholderia multivorans]
MANYIRENRFSPRLRLAALGIIFAATCSNGYAQSWNKTSPVTYASPIHLTTPDQDYVVRRPVTDRDRDLIARYRSGKLKPDFETRFTRPADLDDWDLLVSENTKLRSCVRPNSVSTGPEGLTLTVEPATDCHAKWSTGQIVSKNRFKYGYFEASMKLAPISGMDNAFWLVTSDGYEIDVTEAFYPKTATSAVHQWHPPRGKEHSMVSTAINIKQDLSKDFHDYSVLWNEKELIFAIDGEPYVALKPNNTINGTAVLHLSNALVPWGAKPPSNPEGVRTMFRGVRVFKLQ